MAYELTCPSCQSRLLLKDDTGEEYLLCPRCLNKVPRPASAGLAPRPAAEISAIAALSTRSTRAVPTVEAETRRWMWPTYFVILTVTVLSGLGVVLTSLAEVRSRDPGVAYAMFRGTRPAPGTPRSATVLKRIVVILLLVILGPIAACIIFGAVCTASLTVVLGR